MMMFSLFFILFLAQKDLQGTNHRRYSSLKSIQFCFVIIQPNNREATIANKINRQYKAPTREV